MSGELPPPSRPKLDRFVWLLAAGMAVLVSLPAIAAWLAAPAGSAYLGYVTNTDDHMVYAAWMRQAMDGRWLFDNRFAVDAQPGLTLNVFFLLLGWLAKLLGIPLATHVARVGFTFAFVVLLDRLLRRLELTDTVRRLALAFVAIGGGIGFMVWHTFGQAIVRPAPGFLSQAMLGRLPIDVWQPEALVLPSALTSSLFMVSLCLILAVFTAMLDSRRGWPPVALGAAGMAVLMNIHSYDVLIVALAMAGFLVATIAQKQTDPNWIVRAAVIGLGAVPPALWFAYVLRSDTVFQARAATETFTPNFRQVVFGLLPLIALALAGIADRTAEAAVRRRQQAAVGLFAALLLVMFVLAQNHQDGYFMGWSAWLASLGAALAVVFLGSRQNPGWNLLLAWAVIGTVAIYFPALFQRKLAMGIAIPWSVLAAVGLNTLLVRQEASIRRLATALGILLVGATSLRWAFREFELPRTNVSTTTVHAAYLGKDELAIVAYLDRVPGRKVVLAPTGVPSALADEQGKPVPDAFASPAMPDLNPILSGFTGAYTYAGHWSETPGYVDRRNEVSRLYYGNPDRLIQRRVLSVSRADYLVQPVPSAFDGLPLANLDGLGEVVVPGDRFRLLRVNKEP